MRAVTTARRLLLIVVLLALAAALAVLPACGTADRNSGSDGGSSSGQVSQADFRDPNLGCGWRVVRSMPLSYARNFSVDYYEGGYKLACLSDGTRYLVVPQGKMPPRGLADDVVVLQQPLDDVYLVASDTGCLFEALGIVGKIAVSGIAEQDWRVDSLRSAMGKGKISYGGKYNAPDYDGLLAHGVGLALESTMINHAPDVREKLESLGIDVMVEQSSSEPDPLGRTEWVRLYGALFDRETEADRVFAAQERAMESVGGQDTGKTVAFFYINSNGQAVVRRPGDYVTKMIARAGGTYVNDDLDSSNAGMSTVTLEMEKFYATAKDADFIVYNATIDGGVDSVDGLVAKNPLLADFKAVREGRVWCTDQNMYQQMVETGSIIRDFHEMLVGEGGDELEYLYRLG